MKVFLFLLRLTLKFFISIPSLLASLRARDEANGEGEAEPAPEPKFAKDPEHKMMPPPDLDELPLEAPQ